MHQVLPCPVLQQVSLDLRVRLLHLYKTQTESRVREVKYSQVDVTKMPASQLLLSFKGRSHETLNPYGTDTHRQQTLQDNSAWNQLV